MTHHLREHGLRYPARAEAATPSWGVVGGVEITGGFGSGVAVAPDGRTFYVLTDRGPNVKTAVPDRILFPLPAFTPQIGVFTLDGDALLLTRTIELTNAAGARLTGIPNPPGRGGTGETPVDINDVPIALDPDGVDTEGLALAGDGTFWISEEYGPSLLHVSAAGRTIERIDPFGSGTGSRKLPAVFLRRRRNHGLEGLTITPDGRTLLGIMQSPLDNPGPAVRKRSNAVRMLAFDIATGGTRQYVYETDAPGLFACDVAAVTDTTFLVLERDDEFPGSASRPSVSKHIYMIDLAAATDVSHPDDGASGRLFSGKTLEEMSRTERSAHRIVPVWKRLVCNLLTLPGGYPHDKPEGVAVIDNRTMVVTNDNDFGVVEDGMGGMQAKVLPMTGERDRLAAYFIESAEPLS